MIKLRNMLMTVIAITSLSFSAHAFEGFSVGAIYSSADFSTTGTETAPGNTAGTNDIAKVTKGGGAEFGSIFGEYTFAQGTTLGIEYIPGDAEIGKASRTQTNSVAAFRGAGEDGGGKLTVSATASDHITFYAEPTYMVNPVFGIYVKGGASNVTITPKFTEENDIIQSTYASQDVWGVMTGIGAKAYYGNWFAKLEYVETEYGEFAVTSTTGDKNTVTADIDVEATRLAIAYNF